MDEVLVKAMNDVLMETAIKPPKGSVSLTVPSDFVLPKERIRMFLARVGFSEIPPRRLVGVWDLVRDISVSWDGYRKETLLVQVGDAIFKSWNPDNMLQVLRCSRCWHSPMDCQHVLALFLALGYHTPQTRSAMTGALWELQLLSRLPEESPSAEVARIDKVDQRHQGWIRYTIHIPEPRRDLPKNDATFGVPDYRGMVERQVIRLGKRDGKELKPQPVPRAMKDLEAKIQGVTAADWSIEQSFERLLNLYTVLKNTYGIDRYEAARTLISSAAAELLLELAQTKDVWLGEHPISVMREPVMPEIHVGTENDQDDAVRLGWKPSIAAFIDIGNGFVLDDAHTLRPLDRRCPKSLKPLLAEQLPEIPTSQLDRFVETFVVRCPVPVRLKDETLWGERTQGKLERRLLLSEDRGALVLSVRFGYTADDGSAEVEPDDPGDLVVIRTSAARPVLVERDRVSESKALKELAACARVDALGSMIGLHGIQAYDFLADGLPKLVDSWVIYGESGLKLHKVHTDLAPNVRVSSGIDWFDVDVSFSAGDVSVSGAELLESWLSGEKYYRLKDGSVARLPEHWLEHHGDTLGEVEDLRRASKKKLGPWAASLAQELLEQADEAEDTWKRLANLLEAFDSIPDFESCVPIHTELRNYQRDGTRWLAFLRDTRLGGILADDMGLGKTLQVLTVLGDTHGADRGGPSLVVAPVSVVYNWAVEAKRFVPSLNVYVHHGKDRKKKIPAKADIVLTSYALLRIDYERLSKIRYRYVVLDEAQYIKNARSKVAKAARSLKTEHRLALTGTPMENNLHDLWSIFQFIMPGFFGTQAAFNRRYAKPIQQGNNEAKSTNAMKRLRTRLRPFVLRRLKRDVELELPPRQEQVLYCELGPDQRRFYDQLRETYRSTVLDEVKEKGVRGATLTILEALTRLRQACCDARLVPLAEARELQHSAKLTLLMETVDEMVASNHRALLFSQWPSFLKLVVAELKKRSIPYFYLDGQTRERQKLVEKWNKPDGPPVFLISLKAGGSGMNLTGADSVIHLDPWWNPAVEAQANARAHRIGQTRPVMSYKLIARDTVEEKILEIQERKLQLMEAALEGDRALVSTLTREDLEAVFAIDV